MAKLHIKKRFLAAAVLFAVFLCIIYPANKFGLVSTIIAINPNLGKFTKASITTYAPEQPLFGSNITSGDISQSVVLAYDKLTSNLDVTPVTYYSDYCSMPTQETIWQYDDYFVRLYVTSSLEADSASITVFSGLYSDFRTDSSFSPISFESPERFLANR